MTYLLTDAILPYFREILVEDIQMSDFVLDMIRPKTILDERPLNKGPALSEGSKTGYNSAYHVGHATSEDMSKKLLQMEDEGLPHERLLMLVASWPSCQ